MPPRVPGQPTPAAAPIVGPRVASGPVPGVHDAVVPLPVQTAVTAAEVQAALATEVASAITASEQARIANQVTELPNFANSVTGVYGISGSGKTSLLVTAIEFCWEEFEMISLVYGTDLGGFGNKMLSLIRHGIARVWDPRNHLNPFETMELASLGAWPEHIDDPETGRAAPNVRLILPRRIKTTLSCPQGHPVASFELAVPRDAAMFESGTFPCPTCGVITGKSNGTTSAQIVRHKMFARVGHRGYDSLTEMNDWGLMRLSQMSALGLLPTGKEGGSLLGSVDALREGSITYGGGSMAQVGFMQNRSYQWIANIRSIPDQVMPATCTFAVEQGKADDDSGGVPVLGPQIAGNARTSKVPRWVGNCLHASREPDDMGRMRYRLWMTSHLDSRDPRKIPYLAKHRGIPLDMPDYLEDPWDDDKAKRDALAWSVCSLGVFYRKLIAQLVKMEAQQRERYKNAPGIQASYEQGDDVIETVSAPAMLAPAAVNVPVAGGPTMAGRRGALRVPGAAVAPAPAPPPVSIPVQTVAAPQGGQPAATTAAAPAAAGTQVPVTAAATPAPVTPVTAAGPPPGIVAQLEASLAQRAPDVVPATKEPQATTAAPSATEPSAPAAVTGSTAATPPATPSRLRSPGGLRVPNAAGAAAAVTPTAPPPAGQATVAPPVVTSAATPTAAPLPPTPIPQVAPAPPPRLAARRTPRPPV